MLYYWYQLIKMKQRFPLHLDGELGCRHDIGMSSWKLHLDGGKQISAHRRDLGQPRAATADQTWQAEKIQQQFRKHAEQKVRKVVQLADLRI